MYDYRINKNAIAPGYEPSFSTPDYYQLPHKFNANFSEDKLFQYITQEDLDRYFSEEEDDFDDYLEEFIDFFA